MILVQINFKFPASMMGEVLFDNAKALAESINHEAGFISKIWIENPNTEESGGIYLFENQETAENYVSMHSERLKEMGVDQVEVKYFQVNKPLSQLNQANLPNV